VPLRTQSRVAPITTLHGVICNYPTGKSPALPACGVSSPACKNILYKRIKIRIYRINDRPYIHPIPPQGALRNVNNAGWAVMDAEGASDEGA
jgi:hypothetical protein